MNKQNEILNKNDEKAFTIGSSLLLGCYLLPLFMAVMIALSLLTAHFLQLKYESYQVLLFGIYMGVIIDILYVMYSIVTARSKKRILNKNKI